MVLKILAVGAILAALTAVGDADAAQPRRGTAALAGPRQPIPYVHLDTYVKASPKLRASTNWWTDSASTGSAANTAAIVRATGGPSAGKLIDPLLTPKGVAPPRSATGRPK